MCVHTPRLKHFYLFVDFYNDSTPIVVIIQIVWTKIIMKCLLEMSVIKNVLK